MELENQLQLIYSQACLKLHLEILIFWVTHTLMMLIKSGKTSDYAFNTMFSTIILLSKTILDIIIESKMKMMKKWRELSTIPLMNVPL